MGSPAFPGKATSTIACFTQVVTAQHFHGVLLQRPSLAFSHNWPLPPPACLLVHKGVGVSAVRKLHLEMRESLELMSVGIGDGRRKDTVAENTTSEKPGAAQKEQLGDVKYGLFNAPSPTPQCPFCVPLLDGQVLVPCSHCSTAAYQGRKITE